MKFNFFSKFLFIFMALFAAYTNTVHAFNYGDKVSLFNTAQGGYFIGHQFLKWNMYDERWEDKGYNVSDLPESNKNASALCWRIVNAKNPNQTGPVRYGDTVGLQAAGEVEFSTMEGPYAINNKYTGNNKFLSCNGDGSLRPDRDQLLANEEWTLFNPSNLNDRNEIPNNGNVALRSHWGRFLTRENDKSVHADREQAQSWETWKATVQK